MSNDPTNEDLIEPDDYDEDDFDDETPDYYLCYCCGYTTITDYGGWGCPRCTAIMSPEYY